MFTDILFSTDKLFVSCMRNDLLAEYMHTRAFGFNELANGNLALWNPYQFSGLPFFGGFQSALLYPPNWIFLCLPLNMAINISVVLHVFLMGACMYAWLRYRDLHPLASATGAVIMMFCGAYFTHVNAGHLSNLSSMVWAPLILLAIDGIFDTRKWCWVLLGSGAVAMQILGGHPQYVYYTAIACAIYTALRMFPAQQRGRIVGLLTIMVLFAAALTAVQLLTGLETAGESVRSKGTPFYFATMFAFPPENLLTLIAPYFFGELPGLQTGPEGQTIFTDPYWGRLYLWEAEFFIGITGLFAAVYGVARGKCSSQWIALGMVLLLFILALGARTPLFQLLYDWVPGYSSFRGTTKFIFPLTLFLVLLATMGFNRMVVDRRVTGQAWMIAVLATVILTCATVAVGQSGSAMWWQDVIQAVGDTRESYLSPSVRSHSEFAPIAARSTAWSLGLGALTCAAIAVLMLLAARQPRAVYGLLILAAIEMTVFARSTVDSFLPPQMPSFNHPDKDNFRILLTRSPNITTTMKLHNLWGIDPGVPLRYAQFMYHTQGHDPDKATQNLRFLKPHRWYDMLRGAILLVDRPQRQIQVGTYMKRLLLIYDYQVIDDREAIFAAMDDAAFNPRSSVVLEYEPDITPTSPTGDAPRAKLVIEDQSTDHLTIRAELASPAILLITDSYSKGWRARALPDSQQQTYQLMPANYVLRAVPLSAGKHHLVIEYMPRGFMIGRWISIIALLVYLGAVGVTFRRRGIIGS
jgi:hypothetical protein